MVRKLVHYSTALATLLVLTGVYLATVDRWLQAPTVKPFAERKPRVDDGDNDALADLFPAGSWQRGLCKRLKTRDGMLLFQNWEQVSRYEWKLWPVTVVVGRGISAETSTAPIIIDSEAGAQIEFDESLDVMSGGAPPIKSGRIAGEVHIYRIRANPVPSAPASASDDGLLPASDDFELRTANVFIDRRKIWTSQPIRMQIGPARVRGEDLTLELNPAVAENGTHPSASGFLNRLELIYLHELSVPLTRPLFGRVPAVAKAAAGRASSGITSQAPVASSSPSYPALLSMVCGGRLQYDFLQHELRLNDSVQLTHAVSEGPVDRFECASLTAVLRDPTDQTRVRESAIDWVRSIHVVGSPLRADLPSLHCGLAADGVRLDTERGEVVAYGESGIDLRYGNATAHLAGLSYSFDPANPNRLGMIDARGGGRIVWTGDGSPFREASWSEQLLVRGDITWEGAEERSPIYVWIDGTVRAMLTDGGRFGADHAEGAFRWRASTADSGREDGQESNWVPEQFIARGRVELDVASAAAQTDLLTLIFEHPTPATRGSAAEGTRTGPTSRLAIEQPTAPPSTGAPVASPPPRPVIRGKTITAKLTVQESRLVGQDFSVEGSVEVIHRFRARDAELPAKMTGEALRLVEGAGQDVVYLRGGTSSPARLDLGDGFFVGPEIRIHPHLNLVDIPHPGDFQLPTAVLPQGPLRWTEPPRCRWRERMSFDGATARMIGGVVAKAALLREGEPWSLHLSGEELQLILQQGVEFRELDTLREASVHQIRLMGSEAGGVAVEAFRHGPAGELQARHLLQAPQLAFLPQGGGKLVGAGPGSYRAWLQKSPWKPDPSINPAVAADRAKTGVHLIYHDAMLGDLAARSLEFGRGVRIGLRQVASWEEAFDAAEMKSIGEGESTLDADRLRIQLDPVAAGSRPPIGGAPLPWELIADGGVLFRTRNGRGLLECGASEATYSSGKDRFTLVRSPSELAVFRQTLPNGQVDKTFTFHSLVLRPADMTVEDMQFQSLTAGGLDSSNRR